MTFNYFIKIEPNQLGYGVYLYADYNGAVYFSIKVTQRSRCDLEMTFKYFIEIEPNQLGFGGLLICRSQWSCLFFMKVTQRSWCDL